MVYRKLILLALLLAGTVLYAQPEWKTFTGEGLGTQYINTYYADRSGNLWLGTNNGVIVYSDGQWLQASRIEDLNSGEGEPLGNVVQFFEDRTGIMFVACDGKMFIYDGKIWISYKDYLFPGFTVRLFLHDSRGDIWLCSEEEEFNQYESVLSKPVINGITTRFNGGRWISYGFEAGGSHYIQSGDPKEYYTSILEDRRGYIWIGAVEGLFIFAGDNWIFLKDETLPGVYVTDMALDGKGDVWVATTNGIARFDGSAWEIYKRKDGIGGNHVRRLETDSQGRVWAFIQGNIGFQGLSCFDGKEWRYFVAGKEVPSGDILSRFDDFDMTGLMIGRSGAAYYDGNSFLDIGKIHGLEGSRFFSLETDSAGKVFIATDRGVYKGAGTEFLPYFAPETGSWAVTAMLCDSRNRTWVATEGRELYAKIEDKVHIFNTSHGLPDEAPRDIVEDMAGRIWIIYRKEVALLSSEF